MKTRYYVDTQGNDDNAYAEAMNHACRLAKADSEIHRIVLLVHTKQNTGWYERLLGRDAIKKLFAGVKIEGCETLFQIETVKTFTDHSRTKNIVIASGLDSEDLFKVDEFEEVKVIIAIPWLREKTEIWVKTWNPTEIRGNQEAVMAYPDPSCIAQMAMRDLTESINMSTGISHPADNERAKTFILALHKYEQVIDGNIIAAFLMRELGWDTDDAQEVAGLIHTLNAGKHFQGGERKGLQHPYRKWETECLE